MPLWSCVGSQAPTGLLGCPLHCRTSCVPSAGLGILLTPHKAGLVDGSLAGLWQSSEEFIVFKVLADGVGHTARCTCCRRWYRFPPRPGETVPRTRPHSRAVLPIGALITGLGPTMPDAGRAGSEGPGTSVRLFRKSKGPRGDEEGASGLRLHRPLVYALLRSVMTHGSPNTCRGFGQSSGCNRAPKLPMKSGRGGCPSEALITGCRHPPAEVRCWLLVSWAFGAGRRRANSLRHTKTVLIPGASLPGSSEEAEALGAVPAPGGVLPNSEGLI